MFERFTESARRVVVLAQKEGRMLDHNYIGTEHILLGLIREGDGVAARVIGSMGLTLEAAREQVEAMVGRGTTGPAGHIPFTPRAKKVLELSLREALELNTTYIGTEHLLLGLMREADGVGAQILERLADPLPTIRGAVIELAAREPGSGIPAPDGPVTVAVSALPSLARSRNPERDMRIAMLTETVAELRAAVESSDRRLAAIERHLGIDAKEPEDPAEPAE
jgi:ATP-dependent Clp protease ATP-binding subunit ClpC